MEDLKHLYDKAYVDKLARQTDFKIKRLLKYVNFKKEDMVVDYGCGDGKLSYLIHNEVSEYHGVDFSDNFIAEAVRVNSNIKNSEFYCEDIIEFAKRNKNKFDKAFSYDFTEHIYDDDYYKFFSAIKDTLKPNGELYIHTPDGNYFIEILKEHNIILKQFPEHVAVRNPKENEKILNEIGFSQVKVRYIPHYVKVLSLFHFLSFIPFIGKYFRARLFITAKQ